MKTIPGNHFSLSNKGFRSVGLQLELDRNKALVIVTRRL